MAYTTNNRTDALRADCDLFSQMKDYYAECLLKLHRGLPTLRVNNAKTYAEAKNEYGAYMDERIRVQLKLNKETPKDEIHILTMPRLYRLTMTEADCEDFTRLCDDDKPITKWLDKRGWVFMTEVYYTPQSNIVMLCAILVPK